MFDLPSLFSFGMITSKVEGSLRLSTYATKVVYSHAPPAYERPTGCPGGRQPVKGGMHFYRGSGAGAARYFDEGHQGAEVQGAEVQGAEAYYTEESRVAVEIDTWIGGERSGSTVLAEPGDLVRWVEGVDAASGEVKGIIRSGGEDRQPLRFVEVVVNNPKSLSVVASQNPAVAAAVDRVLARQADDLSRYLSAVAVTRIGPRGAQIEVGGLTVETARVAHLTSREGDPHRHIHLMVNTRVKTPDGTWHGLHSAALRQHIRAVNELGSRILVTDAELRQVLAGEGYTLGADGEIDQARSVVEMMSKRSVQVAANRTRLEAEWRTEHPGREPSRRVINGWDQEAWAEDRKAKPVGRESAEEMSERVRVELAAAGYDFTLGARWPVVGWEQAGVSVGAVDRDRVAAEAVAVLSGRKSAWSSADLTAEVEAAVSRTGVTGADQAVTELVEDCGARASEQCLSVLAAEAWTPTVMSRHLTSEAVINADQRLNLGLAGLAGLAVTRDVEGAGLALAQGLDPGQAEAVASVCGTGRLEVIIGPAGTGKTRMLAVAADRLDAQGRDLVIVAPTRKAALVAGAEVGADGASLSKLVYDHGFRWDDLGRWTRLAVGDEDPAAGRTYRGPKGASILSERSVVVVDEAALMTVDQANALVDIAAESGAAVRLVGDPRQLGAVGRGGVMETAGRWADNAVTLDQVHCFLAVTVDETGMPVTGPDTAYAELSLLLRDGDDPDRVADQLIGRGAVIVHHSEDDAMAAMAAEIAAQGEALTVTVATNSDAQVLNEAVRDLRVGAGEVDDTQTATGMDGVRIGAGDRIVTRRNDTARDVANRETWTVRAVTDDGTVVASAGDRHVRLDAGYLAGHTQLGYAATDYGNQGTTNERSSSKIGPATTAGGLYVATTRGRYTNNLHLVAADVDDAHAQLVAVMGRDRADRSLDAARARAEADAVAVTDRAEVPAAPETIAPETIDPAGWRTGAELADADRAVQAQLDEGLRALRDVPVMADEAWQRDDQADREAAEQARQRATQHRADAQAAAGGRDEVVTTATAEFFAARDDARTIEAGPGRFGRKADQVHDAEARRAETARRWSTRQLPGSRWDDDTVRHDAAAAAERIVNTRVDHHMRDADQADQGAETMDRQIAERDRSQQAERQTNERHAAQRDALVAAAERDRADIARRQEQRNEHVAAMTPDQVGAADQARNAYLADQGRRVGAVQGRPRGPQGPQPDRRTPTRRGPQPDKTRQDEAARRAQQQRRNRPGPGFGR